MFPSYANFMVSPFLLTTVVAAATGLYTLFRKCRIHQNNKEEDTSSSSVISPPSPSRIWTHHVFTSFRGEDVRRDFLSHVLMEFQRMGITPFIDNEIKRGESIAPELVRAIRGSKIAIILLSWNYASSKWCLDELVEIMKCRDELGQTVIVIFYKVDPSHVKSLTGDFGRVFRKTCAGKSKEDIGRWKQALEKVATVAGYHSNNWDNEAAMIKKIVGDISNKLNNAISSSDFNGLVGMRAHLEKLERLLCLDSDEVRMIGIWGPPGIGKTTIARVAYNQLSSSFQLSVFMENIRSNYKRPYFDDYSTKLRLQQQFMSQITNQKDMVIPHLGVVQDRLKDKKVLVVLDGVDHLIQLHAIAKETWWFGPGSRIIITTQDHKLLRAPAINHIYKVGFPRFDEALQILCMYAFDQNSPKEGFEELAWKATRLAGDLPLGLRVMGSYFRGMSKQEWIKSLPRLETCLDGDIRSVLKFSYDALDDEDKELFLYIACLFNHEEIEIIEEHLAKKFSEVRQRLNVLAEKSLIYINSRYIDMHSLLEKLGREIVHKQSIHEPGQHQFLVDKREICEVLTGDAAGSKSVIGIDFSYGGEELDISERAFEAMPNLRFLSFYGKRDTLKLPRGLKYLSSKLQILAWSHFPLTCLPSIVNLESLVELHMPNSKLEKMWEGIQPIPNLKWMDLSWSVNLKELPGLSTATNLQRLNLSYCSSLVKLPSTTGNAKNLEDLDLSNCSNLVELPHSIGNLQKLQKLRLGGCSKLEVLPTNINLESLDELDFTDCSMLKSFPEISTNVKVLKLLGTAVEYVPPSIMSWPHLEFFQLTYFKKLEEFPHALETITWLRLSEADIQEVPPCVKRISRLYQIEFKGCRKLVSLSHIPNSLSNIDAEDCESLERLDCSFHNPRILNFAKCFKLNQEARDSIIKARPSSHAILPGREVPPEFTHRANSRGSLTIKLNERPLPASIKFKTCILLVNKADVEAYDDKPLIEVIKNCIFVGCGNRYHFVSPVLAEHLYIFEGEAEVTSSEVVIDLEVHYFKDLWKIGECGLLRLS